jgi:hypothetical protein
MAILENKQAFTHLRKKEAHLRMLRRLRKIQIRSIIVSTKKLLKTYIVLIIKLAGKVKTPRVLLLFIVILVILLVTTMLLSSAAFAAGSPEIPSEAKLALALTFAGVVTVTTFVFSLRYALFGSTLSEIADKTTDGLNGLCKKYIGEKTTHPSSETAGTSGTAPENVVVVTPGQIELTADRILDKVAKTMDARVDRLNPVTYAEGAKDKMVAFIKKVLTYSKADGTGEWASNLESHLIDGGGLTDDRKILIQTAIQGLARALEKEGADIGKAFENIDLETMEAMAEYTCVSVASRSSGGGSMSSMMEPSFHYSLVAPSLVLVTILLKLSPFSLYFWILAKQIVNF